MASNRALWNEWTAIHERSEFYDLESFKAGGVRLRDYEIEEVGDIRGRSLLHLQCHFGIDTLSWARLGAEATGVDYSERAVTLARSLAEELGLDARFVLANVYDLPEVLDDRFDVVYTSRGVTGWLPDLNRWAKVITHFLRPGGIFYITEVHPVALAMSDTPPPRPAYAYWERTAPQSFPVAGSYADLTAEVSTPLEHSWNHAMSEIVQSLIDAGLTIELFREYPWCDWDLGFCAQHDDGLWYLHDDVGGELPLFFALRARKHG
jgi:SAM-dependent methyltransferase